MDTATTTTSTTASTTPSELSHLPEGLLARAFGYLEPESLFAAAQVSHKWNDLASSDTIWEKYSKYAALPPSGAWKPKGKKPAEPEQSHDGREKEEKEQKDKEKEKKEAQKWDGSKALQWLRQQTDEGRPRVLGGISYEVEGQKDHEITKRKHKEIFRQHGGRGWYLPGFNFANKPDGARVQFTAGRGSDEKLKVTVDNKPVFKVATQSQNGGFWFERLIGKETTYDASANEVEKALKGLGGTFGLQEKLRKGNLRFDAKTLNTLASLFPSGKYDVACVRVWPQQITCGTNEHPENGTKGDYWRHEWTKEGWNNEGVPENERYYRCWTHTKLLNWPVDEQTPGLDVLFNTFVIPLQHVSLLDRALVDEYKREWENDSTYIPTAVALGSWDQRNVPSSYDNPLIRATSGVHLVNFLVDGHHKIQAAAELGKPIHLLTFIQSDNFSNNKHEVVLRLANTRWTQPPPKREPSKIVSTLPKAPGESSLLFRLGYCVNATAVEVADVLRKENIRPKRVVVSQETWQILVQLHDQDVATFNNIFTVTSSSATAPLYYEKHVNGVEPAPEGVSDVVEGTEPAAAAGNGEAHAAAEGASASGEEGKAEQPQQPHAEKPKEAEKAASPAAGKPSPVPAKGAAKGQSPAGSTKGSPSSGGKAGAKGAKSPSGGGGKTRGGGKGGKGGKGSRGGKGGRGGGRKGEESSDELSFVGTVAAQGRPKWLHLKALNEIGNNLIHPKIPIDEDLEDYGAWDERDLSIWTHNKRRGGGGGALGNRPPRRHNNWKGENGGGNQGGGYNNSNFRGPRGPRGRRGGGAPGGYFGGAPLGGPILPLGAAPVGGMQQGGYLGPPAGSVGAGVVPQRGRRPNRGRGGGGGRGRFVNPTFYPKYGRPAMVFAQELPQELAHMQGVPLNPPGPNNMLYLNNAAYPPLGGEKPLQEGMMVPPGGGGVPQMGGVPMGMVAGGPVSGMVGPGGVPVPAGAPGQMPPPVRTGGGGLCHFYFNTNVGCRYGEHCWFSHELPPQLLQQQLQQQQLQQQLQQQQPPQNTN